MARRREWFRAFSTEGAAYRYLRGNALRGRVERLEQPCEGGACLHVAIVRLTNDDAARHGLRPVSELRRTK